MSTRSPDVLQTERLELTPLGPDCWDAYRAFYTDADASALYGGPLSEATAHARLARDIGSWTLQGLGVWAVRLRQERRVVGTCGFWQGLGWPCELTWWLLPEARGAGLAAEASRAVIAAAYEHFGWQVVQTYFPDENLAARKLAQRLGGERTERRRFPDGVERDVYTFRRPERSHSNETN